jgi:hypothetical protein
MLIFVVVGFAGLSLGIFEKRIAYKTKVWFGGVYTKRKGKEEKRCKYISRLAGVHTTPRRKQKII